MPKIWQISKTSLTQWLSNMDRRDASASKKVFLASQENPEVAGCQFRLRENADEEQPFVKLNSPSCFSCLCKNNLNFLWFYEGFLEEHPVLYPYPKYGDCQFFDSAAAVTSVSTGGNTAFRCLVIPSTGWVTDCDRLFLWFVHNLKYEITVTIRQKREELTELEPRFKRQYDVNETLFALFLNLATENYGVKRVDISQDFGTNSGNVSIQVSYLLHDFNVQEKTLDLSGIWILAPFSH